MPQDLNFAMKMTNKLHSEASTVPYERPKSQKAHQRNASMDPRFGQTNEKRFLNTVELREVDEKGPTSSQQPFNNTIDNHEIKVLDIPRQGFRTVEDM